MLGMGILKLKEKAEKLSKEKKEGKFPVRMVMCMCADTWQWGMCANAACEGENV